VAEICSVVVAGFMVIAMVGSGGPGEPFRHVPGASLNRKHENKRLRSIEIFIRRQIRLEEKSDAVEC
jgi:hypothetical protein